MKKAAVLCMVLLATSMALGQADRSLTPIQAEPTVRTGAAEPLRAVQLTDADGETGLFGYSEMDFEADGGARCPPNSFIVGQDVGTGGGTYFYSDLGYCDPNNPARCRRATAESFPPKIATGPSLTEPIRTISWYGSYIDSTQNGCVKPAHNFRIRFYNDSGPPNYQPVISSFVHSFNVTANARVVGTINWSGGGASLQYLFWVVLPTPVNMPRGHIAIVSPDTGNCFHLLAHSTDDGDSRVWRWYETDNFLELRTQNDIAYCVGRYIPGACCNDWSGNCNENSDDFSCFYEAYMGTTPPGGRFTTGNCNDFDPLCGQIPGACCKADETCIPNLTRNACEQISGAFWRGPQTTCEQCCWIPQCPGGAHIEAEDCGQDTNGGCRVTPPVFETIPLQGTEPSFSRTVCGTVWADGGLRDEDWYEFTADQQFEMTIQNVNSRVPIRLTPYFDGPNHGPPDCANLWYYVDTLYEPCVTRPPFTPPVFPRGKYWIYVTPQDADGPVTNFYPCGTANEYYFELLVEYITCPDPCNIPGAIVIPEGEPNYCTNPEPDTFNSGCDHPNPPGPMLPITDNFEIWCGKSGWYELGPEICRGDLDCSGFVDFGDINPFVLALTNPGGWQQQYPNCPWQNGDLNEDEAVNFGDINPFVALLAGGGGQPIPCPTGDALVADYDWYRFQIVNGPKTASIFMYAEFPVNWEVYQASAGCGAPALERRRITPCLSDSKKTFCLPTGTYWLRVFPDAGVECGKEYALGLEEFLGCTPCSVTCPTPNTPEAEPCGDNTNGGCNSTPNAFEDIACNATICATTWADDGVRDTDWFRLVLTAPRYLIFTVQTEVPVLTGFMDTSVANCSYLFGYWINVEDCTAEPSSWYFVDQGQQPVQFDPGTYWWTVFPDDGEDPLFYSYPCNRPAPFDLNTYWFQIECTTTPPS